MEIKKYFSHALCMSLLLSSIAVSLYAMEGEEYQEPAWKRYGRSAARGVGVMVIGPISSTAAALSVLKQAEIKRPKALERLKSDLQNTGIALNRFKKCLLGSEECSEREKKKALSDLKRYTTKGLSYGFKIAVLAALAYIGYKGARAFYVAGKHKVVPGEAGVVAIFSMPNDFLIENALRVYGEDKWFNDKQIEAAYEIYFGNKAMTRDQFISKFGLEVVNPPSWQSK